MYQSGACISLVMVSGIATYKFSGTQVGADVSE
jgi:hypothetical protein